MSDGAERMRRDEAAMESEAGAGSAGAIAGPSRRGRVLLGVAALALLIVLGRRAGAGIPQLAAWVEDLGAWGPLAFVVAYAAATVAFVPVSLLTLAAGAIFGVAEGTLWVFVAATIGAALAFLVSRHWARAAVERRVAGTPRFAALDRAVAEQGLKIVLLLRLSPLFPFNALNYALGLTRVSFRDFLVGSLGMLPGTLLYVYYGALAGEVAALAGGAAPSKGAAAYTVWGIGLLATIAVTAFVTRLARRALSEVTGE
jgi:uncharacterized membrane protein YdjX (TVP38/TMEM64 family)